MFQDSVVQFTVCTTSWILNNLTVRNGILIEKFLQTLPSIELSVTAVTKARMKAGFTSPTYCFYSTKKKTYKKQTEQRNKTKHTWIQLQTSSVVKWFASLKYFSRLCWKSMLTWLAGVALLLDLPTLPLLLGIESILERKSSSWYDYKQQYFYKKIRENIFNSTENYLMLSEECIRVNTRW
jgi:hypothetical protein